MTTIAVAESVEAHRLGVQQRNKEHILLMAFELGLAIGNQAEGRRIALSKSIADKLPHPPKFSEYSSALRNLLALRMWIGR